MTRYDVVVVGAGVMGAATARWLSRDRSVLLLEQFQIGHIRGSSHGRSRIFRFSYPDPTFVAMAQESEGLWRDLEAESGRSLLTVTGGLDRGDHISDNVRALTECGAAFELIDGKEAMRRFDIFDLPTDEPVLFQPDAGFVAADDAVRAFVDGALSSGAELLQHTRVIAIDLGDGEVGVVTDDATFLAPVVVVTAGGWARRLLRSSGIELPTRETRETVAYFEIGTAIFPPLVEWGPPAVYSLPSPGQGIKVGEHIAGPDTDADDEGRVNEASVARLSEWIARRCPTANPQPHLSETCIYTNTVDEHFILERQGPIVVGSACSGHAFKFAPLIGKRLAALSSARE